MSYYLRICTLGLAFLFVFTLHIVQQQKCNLNSDLILETFCSIFSHFWIEHSNFLYKSPYLLWIRQSKGPEKNLFNRMVFNSWKSTVISFICTFCYNENVPAVKIESVCSEKNKFFLTYVFVYLEELNIWMCFCFLWSFLLHTCFVYNEFGFYVLILCYSSLRH